MSGETERPDTAGPFAREVATCLSDVREESWRQRVERRFQAIAASKPLDEKYSEEQNRELMISSAQFQADKEMLNEIHLMLRLLTGRTLRQ